MEARKILVVEDQPQLRKSLTITLSYKNHEILEASDGAQALQLVAAHKPEIVLLDVMLPGNLNGFQICDAIKKNPELNKTYVVILTALGQQSDQEKGKAAGADIYMTKPFSPMKLISIIESQVP
jgi:DNA-binding response OmpR family regulator